MFQISPSRYPPGNDHISPFKGTFESMIFRLSRLTWDMFSRSLEGTLPPIKTHTGHAGHATPTWRIIHHPIVSKVVNNHSDRKSPKDRVVGPLPNGRNSWLINGGDPTHLHPPGSPSSKHPTSSTSSDA